MFLYLTLSLLGTRGEPGHLGRQLKGPAVNNDRRAAGSEGGQLGANKAFECVTNNNLPLLGPQKLDGRPVAESPAVGPTF